MARGGRIFSFDALRNKEPTPTKKEKTTESPKRTVMEEKAREFLKVLRHSEYEMLDQLHKTLVRISLLSLLINSESHLWKLHDSNGADRQWVLAQRHAKTTLDKLYCPGAILRNSPVVVRAFDSSK
ncbi:hypothetical protein CR513_16261, partial [Mucuna pruriens]